MDRQRFDAFTRLLGRGHTRRAAVRFLLGGIVGGVALTAAGNRALAQGACGGERDSCENQDCCDGYACNADLVCAAAGGTCGLEGESCENQNCCEGLSCSADLACVIPDEGAGCGYEGDSCENQDCCAGLVCSSDLACVIPDSGTDGGTTLPGTGVGPTAGGGDEAMLGLAVAGGAAALGALALSRRQRSAQ